MAPQLHLYIPSKNNSFGFILYQETYTIYKKKRLRICFIRCNLINNTFDLYQTENNSKWFLDNITTLRLKYCSLNSTGTQFICSVADYSSSKRTNNFDDEHKSYIVDINNETNKIIINKIISQRTSYDIPPIYCMIKRGDNEDVEEKLIYTPDYFWSNIINDITNDSIIKSNLVCSSSSTERSGCKNTIIVNVNDIKMNIKMEKSKIQIDDMKNVIEIDLYNIN
jgi:hypothetical protein